MYGGPSHEAFAQVGNYLPRKRYPPGDNKSTNSTRLGDLRGTVKLLNCALVDRTQLLKIISDAAQSDNLQVEKSRVLGTCKKSEGKASLRDVLSDLSEVIGIGASARSIYRWDGD